VTPPQSDAADPAARAATRHDARMRAAVLLAAVTAVLVVGVAVLIAPEEADAYSVPISVVALLVAVASLAASTSTTAETELRTIRKLLEEQGRSVPEPRRPTNRLERLAILSLAILGLRAARTPTRRMK
jgi:hypothetical protein